MKRGVVKKPWGSFEQFTLNEKSTVKILTVHPKKRFSLQFHNDREELWVFLDNPAKVTIGKDTIKVKKGDKIFVRKKQRHRIEALSKKVKVLEISFGNFSERDIVRIEDDFGRT